MEIRIEKYTSTDKNLWDTFVSSSKNGTFLFFRDFMEYHSDRFTDFSLLFYFKNKLVGLLPSNVVGSRMYSHQGLTYGGLILSESATTKLVIHIFESLKIYLKNKGISQIQYKSIPHIYHKLSSEEDLYVLFRQGAKLVGRSISSCVSDNYRIKYSELRKRGIRKAQYESLVIQENNDFTRFWKILEDNLSQKYNVSPVHSLDEIQYLKSKFPHNIRLFEIFKDEELFAGCVIFETDCVAHVQYISASEKGKKYGALDFLFDYLIQKIYLSKPFFEFGISTEENGRILNEGLISQKEGFGGRGIVYDIYELSI